MLKITTNRDGFSPILLLVILVVMAVVGFALFRVSDSKDNQNNTQTANNQSVQNQDSKKSTEQEKDLELQNLGIATLNEVVITSDALREFESKGLKGFYVFGDTLPGGRQNPNFEFASLKKTTEVIAATDGVVVNINEQNEGGLDYEVFIQPKEGSVWTIGYDHLVNLNVKKGDLVKAGDLLGNPAPQNNGSYRFEMQVNKDTNETTHVCPASILASDVKDRVLSELQTMLESWESQTGLELYDIAAQNPVGCIKPTLTPAEAEGR